MRAVEEIRRGLRRNCSKERRVHAVERSNAKATRDASVREWKAERNNSVKGKRGKKTQLITIPRTVPARPIEHRSSHIPAT